MIHQFRTTLKSNEITIMNENHINGYNNESDEIVEISDMIIIWQVEFELREWGIKSAIPSIIDFEFTVSQDDYTDPDTNEVVKGFEEVIKNSDHWKLNIEHDNFTFECIALSDCIIDFNDGTIDFY